MEDKKQVFLDNFLNIYSEEGYYDFCPYVTGEFGFSLKKKFNKDGFASLISIYINKEDLKNDNHKKLLRVRTTYGKISDGGIMIRVMEDSSLFDPVDTTSDNEYYYDIEKNIFYKKNKIITAKSLLSYIYGSHIKTTEKFRGMWLRFKMFFYQRCLSSLFGLFSKLFTFLLYVISSDKYSYDPVLEKEKYNEPSGDNKSDKAREIKAPGKKFDFFGYEASRWSIFLYSLIHLIVYFILIFNNYHNPNIKRVFENNFLVLAYVIVTLSFFEAILPKIIIYLIKISSTWSFKIKYKRIKI